MTQFIELLQSANYDLPLIVTYLMLMYIGILWVAVVTWVFKDATSRSNSPLFIILSIFFVAIANLPGLILYMLIRPEQTIEDGKSHDLFFASVLDTEVSNCHECGQIVRHDYEFCPNCSSDLKLECADCDGKINPAWKYCVHCNFRLEPKSRWEIFSENAQAKWDSVKAKKPSFDFRKQFKLKKKTNKDKSAKKKVAKTKKANKSKAKKFKFPKLQLPKISKPKLTLPKISKPKLALPKIKLPKVQLPKLNLRRKSVKIAALKKSKDEKVVAEIKEKPKKSKSKSKTKNTKTSKKTKAKKTSKKKSPKKASPKKAKKSAKK